MSTPPSPADPNVPDLCPKCDKPRAICVCDRVTVLRPRTRVVILQHPQEPDKVLGTAKLTAMSLRGAEVRVGLSWGSLAQAVEDNDADAKRWGVLYTGSLPRDLTPMELKAPMVLLDRNGHVLDPAKRPLDGIIVIDGTWSQAKTLWWRNAWLLKLARVVLHPKEPSAYGKLREQSQRTHLATIEATAETLSGLGEKPEIKAQLMKLFRTMLQRARDAQATGVPGAPPAPRKRPPGRKPRGSRGGGTSRGGGPMD
jgi:DTW domain-containing protein YfiP